MTLNTVGHLVLKSGLPELPGGQLCEHPDLPDDRWRRDLPCGLHGLLRCMEGEQMSDLHLRLLPRHHPCCPGND